MSNWAAEIFDNALDGVSSAVSPELILPTQNAWAVNVVNRGSRPATRPSFRRLMTLPAGLVQGASYFSVQGGMGVASINGRFYRLRINPRTTSYSEIILPLSNGSGQDLNSPVIKQVYMQQTVETLVIQDGQSDPVLYNGSTVRRSDVSKEVPRGRQMAYGNGRLWVAIGGKNLVAGDIRTNVEGSELAFTETNYLSGGGTLFFPRGITGLAFIATTGTSDYGALMVFGSDYAESVRADITFRDQWASTPGFVTNVLRHTGCASHWSLTSVNQDIYWRDSAGGIRSIRSSLDDESGAGNSPISREVARLTDFDSPQLLNFCSGISFDNRLLMTSSPRLNQARGITWRDLISLDFAPISTMRGKSAPAYDGRWTGINFTHLFQGIFDGKSRAFAISHDNIGSNSLWEINLDGLNGIADTAVTCSNGSGLITPERITSMVETRRVLFGNPTKRKRLERFDLYLSDIQGELDYRVYWRTDNNQKWLPWEETTNSVCAKTTDPVGSGAAPHVWKNLLPQQRPQLKTFTIPNQIDGITNYSFQTGFEFQMRIVWTGKAKIHKGVLYAMPVDESDYANRDLVSTDCLFNDVSGDDIDFDVPVDPCPELNVSGPDDVTVSLDQSTVFEQYDGPFNYPALAFGGGFFSTAAAGGENRSKFQFYGGSPWGVTCCVPQGSCPMDYEPGKGAVSILFSGVSSLNAAFDGYTGQLTGDVFSRGAWPSTAFIYPSPTRLTINSQTVDGLKHNLFEVASVPFYAQRHEISTNYSNREVIEKFYSDTDYHGIEGFFGGGSGGQIWCLGYSCYFLYRDIITQDHLGASPVTFGDPAKTQHLVSNGPNAYVGTISRAKIRVNPPAGRANFFIEYVYTVTPDDGSGAYETTLNIEYPVTTPGAFFVYEEFPKIVDATVTSTKITVLFEKVLSDEFSGPDIKNELTELPSSPGWPNAGVFSVSVPNSEAWDNFEGNPEGLIYLLSFGYGWADIGRFVTTDPVQAYDSFDSYAPGDITSLYGGVGWAAFGQFYTISFQEAFDEFDQILALGQRVMPNNSPLLSNVANSFITIPANAAYDLGDFTIEMRFKVQQIGNPFSFPVVLFSDLNGGDGIELLFTGAGVAPPFAKAGQSRFTLKAGGTQFIVNGVDQSPASQSGTWLLISIVREGSIITIYNSTVGGTLVDVSVDTGIAAAMSGTADLILGNRADASKQFLGDINELRIWDHARTIDEIRSVRNQRVTGAESGLVGYFPMLELTGPVADLSATANDGSRGSGVTIDQQIIEVIPGSSSIDASNPNFWAQIGVQNNVPYTGKFNILT